MAGSLKNWLKLIQINRGSRKTRRPPQPLNNQHLKAGNPRIHDMQTDRENQEKKVSGHLARIRAALWRDSQVLSHMGLRTKRWGGSAGTGVHDKLAGLWHCLARMDYGLTSASLYKSKDFQILCARWLINCYLVLERLPGVTANTQWDHCTLTGYSTSLSQDSGSAGFTAGSQRERDRNYWCWRLGLRAGTLHIKGVTPKRLITGWDTDQTCGSMTSLLDLNLNWTKLLAGVILYCFPGCVSAHLIVKMWLSCFTAVTSETADSSS